LGGSSVFPRLMAAHLPAGLREPSDRSPASASRRGASSISFPTLHTLLLLWLREDLRSFSPWRPARPWPSRPLKGWMKPVLSCAKLALIFYPTGHYK